MGKTHYRVPISTRNLELEEFVSPLALLLWFKDKVTQEIPDSNEPDNSEKRIGLVWRGSPLTDAIVAEQLGPAWRDRLVRRYRQILVKKGHIIVERVYYGYKVSVVGSDKFTKWSRPEKAESADRLTENGHSKERLTEFGHPPDRFWSPPRPNLVTPPTVFGHENVASPENSADCRQDNTGTTQRQHRESTDSARSSRSLSEENPKPSMKEKNHPANGQASVTDLFASLAERSGNWIRPTNRLRELVSAAFRDGYSKNDIILAMNDVEVEPNDKVDFRLRALAEGLETQLIANRRTAERNKKQEDWMKVQEAQVRAEREQELSEKRRQEAEDEQAAQDAIRLAMEQ